MPNFQRIIFTKPTLSLSRPLLCRPILSPSLFPYATTAHAGESGTACGNQRQSKGRARRPWPSTPVFE